MRQKYGSERDLKSPFIDGEFFATGSEEWITARVSGEIQRHAASFEKANQAIKERLDKEWEPLIKEINDDLAANQQRVPEGISIIETNPHVRFISSVKAYRKALQEATRSQNLHAIDPAEFLPEDDFVAAVE
jgi:hypothetical protein